ncbi:hypothetical protein [Mesorhizobium sp.]|uniref:hypothetical protein n=1 Tax=Mesorhizobium sp. TaxID=1871066 RepID=UPI000FE54C5A|nr:hypothetical protein [Mesorhizobium sp.]RWE78123.1 MAG: hypothetical protein EOS42_06250 [Mesorhizobium sp.]TIV32544.1 MAG: hypothetical protein E5V90_02625 [Mesorhizobium sp.]
MRFRIDAQWFRVCSVTVSLFLVSSLAGCLPSLSDGPPRLVSVAEETQALRQTVGFPDLTNTSSAYRNAYVTTRMYAIDLAYSQYEASLTHERQDVSFIADVTNIGLTGTASLAGAAETKAILAGIAAGLTGAKSSYTNDILFSRTVEVLQTQMRANRAEVATRIIGNLKKPTAVYPIQFALSDLEDYYRAGTLSGAMIAVGSTVATKELVAEQTKAQAIAATIITNPKTPIPPPVRGPSPVEINRFTDAEKILRTEQIKGIQHLFCIQEDGKLGPHGSPTRRKIKEFLVSKNVRKATDDDTIDFEGRATLLDALDEGAPQCK